MNCVALFNLISKQWANVKDIMLIASCGRDKASEIRDSITNEIVRSGKHLPTTKEKIVPMTSVIEYLNLDIEHIASMAQKEKLIKS